MNTTGVFKSKVCMVEESCEDRLMICGNMLLKVMLVAAGAAVEVTEDDKDDAAVSSRLTACSRW